jgi:hypothetical protein
LGLMLISRSRCLWADLSRSLSRGTGSPIEGVALSFEVATNPDLPSTGDAIGDGRG